MPAKQARQTKGPIGVSRTNVVVEHAFTKCPHVGIFEPATEKSACDGFSHSLGDFPALFSNSMSFEEDRSSRSSSIVAFEREICRFMGIDEFAGELGEVRAFFFAIA